MLKLNKKYPLEISLEKWVNKARVDWSWAFRVIVRFFFVVPKRKDERFIYMIQTGAYFLITIGWLLLTYARIRTYF